MAEYLQSNFAISPFLSYFLSCRGFYSKEASISLSEEKFQNRVSKLFFKHIDKFAKLLDKMKFMQF